MGTHVKDFICPRLFGAFFQELGWSPRTRGLPFTKTTEITKMTKTTKTTQTVKKKELSVGSTEITEATAMTKTTGIWGAKHGFPKPRVYPDPPIPFFLGKKKETREQKQGFSSLPNPEKLEKKGKMHNKSKENRKTTKRKETKKARIGGSG